MMTFLVIAAAAGMVAGVGDQLHHRATAVVTFLVMPERNEQKCVSPLPL